MFCSSNGQGKLVCSISSTSQRFGIDPLENTLGSSEGVLTAKDKFVGRTLTGSKCSSKRGNQPHQYSTTLCGNFDICSGRTCNRSGGGCNDCCSCSVCSLLLHQEDHNNTPQPNSLRMIRLEEENISDDEKKNYLKKKISNYNIKIMSVSYTHLTLPTKA